MLTSFAVTIPVSRTINYVNAAGTRQL